MNLLAQQKIYNKTLNSGAKCYIIPKSDFVESMAAICVDYGSADTLCVYDGKICFSPPGAAHFIEHRLFVKENTDVFAQLSQNGATANAFTDFNKTAYYFSSTENFYNNLELLINMVITPFFDPKGVEDEKSIITREIKMYGDNPYWKAYFNLLGCMYHSGGITSEIAGSVEDAQKITAEALNESYVSHYTSDKISLICVGNVNPQKVIDVAERLFRRSVISGKDIKPKETPYLKKRFSLCDMRLNMPVFSIGFKHTPYFGAPAEEKLRRRWAYRLIFEITLGESSELFEELLPKGLLFEPLGFEHICGEGYSASIITGCSSNPRKTADKIYAALMRAAKNGFDKESFENTLNRVKGRFIRGCDSVNALALSQTDYASFCSADLNDGFRALCSVTADYALSVLKSDFSSEKTALAVVK